MSLWLIITSYHKITPGQCSEKRLAQGQLSIGRAAECDWVLPDPERLVSSQHCLVQSREAGYYLTDTSTNGVTFKNTGVQLRRGNSERLQDGDVIQLGNYVIEVRIEAGAFAQPSGVDAGFMGFDSAPSVAGHAPGFDELLRNMGAASSGVANAGTADPFAATTPFSGLETHPNLFDFAAQPVVHADHVAAQNQHFTPPVMHVEPLSVVPEVGSNHGFSAIPEDWHLSEISAAEPAVDPFASQPLAKTTMVDDPFAGIVAQPVQTSTPLVPQVPPAQQMPESVPQQPAPELATDLLQAFLRGAGLERVMLQPEADRVAQMEAIGRSYRHMVEGLVDVLRARSSLKGEFRISHTVIQPVENNPLKFAPNVDEALLLLLRPGNNAFMAPDQAINESFTDIKAHQLAVMAGTQAAIKHLLKRFEPAALEARLDSPGLLAALLPGARQARYWELFTQLYASLSREAEDDFQELFGREFSRAYEAQIANLRQR